MAAGAPAIPPIEPVPPVLPYFFGVKRNKLFPAST
jgi:hypothetical protein